MSDFYNKYKEKDQKEFDEIAQYVNCDSLKGSKWLITGATGMLGSYLTDFLIYLNNKENLSMDFTLIYRNEKYLKSSLGGTENIKWLKIDLSKEFKIENLHSYNYIVHAASNAAPKQYFDDPIGTINANVSATQYFLENVKDSTNIRTFLYVSSGEIYGDAEISPTSEDYLPKVNHLNDRACYVESKRFTEVLCNTYSKLFNIPVKIIRPIHIFGKGFKENDSRVWADFIYNAIKHNKINILSDGKSSRGFCYLPAAISQILSIIQNGKINEVYNVGSDCSYSILQLAEIIKDIMAKYYNLKIEINVENNVPLHLKNSPQRSCPNINKVKDLGYLLEYTMEEALKRSIDWYIEQNSTRG